jgi:hypothetical protein
MIRSWFVLSFALLLLMGYGCSGSSGTRSNNKGFFGPGSAPATAPVVSAGPACPGDLVGDDPANSNPIGAVPTGAQVSIDCVGDQDVFEVFFVQGTSYTISTVNNGQDVQIVLIDTDQLTILAFDETPGGAIIATGPAPVSDLFYIGVLAPTTAPNSLPSCALSVQ